MTTICSLGNYGVTNRWWRILILGAAVLILACVVQGSELYTWTGLDGPWSNEACWTPAGIPDGIDEAAIVPAAVVVDLDLSPSIDWLNIENSMTILELNDRTLSTVSGFTNAGLVKIYDGTATIAGPLTNLATGEIRVKGSSFGLNLSGPTLVNDGDIVVNYDRWYDAILNCTGNVALSGAGNLLLNDDGNDARLETLPGFTLTQAAGHTIHGRGRIHAAVDNAGLILADVPGAALELRTNPKFNSGLMESNNSSHLDIIGTTVTQFDPGEILADAGSVRLNDGATVTGGKLSSLNGGAIYSDSGVNTLEEVTLTDGSWLGITGNTGPLNLTGSFFHNDGTLVVNHNRWYSSALAANETMNIDGTGEILLNDDGSGAELITAEGVSLMQSEGHTIRGYGQVHAALVNEGTIVADVSAKSLELRTHAKTNHASMTAESGGYLDLYGFALTQSEDAQLLAEGEGSQVRLRGGVSISGGSFGSLDGGAVYADAGVNTLENVTLNGGSWFGLAGNTGPLNLMGDTLTNDGTVVVNHNRWYSFTVNVNSDLNLLGSGELILNDDDSGAQLSTAPGVTLTNTAAHTIRGYGWINAAMVNDGTVLADGEGKTLELRTEAKTNNGVMKAGSGADLNLRGMVLTQSPSAWLLAEDGGAVHLRDGATVSGGIMAATGDGEFYSDGGANTIENGHLTPGTWFGLTGNTGPLNLTGAAFTNDGTLIVNHNRWYSGTLSIIDDLVIQGSGEIVLNDDGSDSQLNTAAGVIFSQAGEHTIRGYGQINAGMVNDGTIAADASGKALELRTYLKVNDALMKAEAGGILDVYGIKIRQIPKASILADGAGSQVRLRGGATIAGGRLSGVNGGVLYSDLGANTLEDITLTSGSWLGITGNTGPLTLTGDTFTNDGTVVVNHNQWYSSTLLVNNDLLLEGSGEVLLNDDGTGAQLNTADGVTLIQGPEHRIRGYGQIHADLVNDGAIIADASGKWLSLNPIGAGMVTEGRMEAVVGCNLEINTAALFTQLGGETLVNGQLKVNGGSLTLEGGTLAGTGTITGSVHNIAGFVEPGESAGKLTISGGYTQESTGELRIEVGGSEQGTNYDLLKLTGSATLAGTITVELINDFVPEPGATFTIMTYASHSGDFTAWNLPKLPKRCFEVSTETTSVVLTVGDLTADANGDWAVDPLDSGFVLARFGCTVGTGDAACDAADVNLDGIVDPLDVGYVLARFGTCP